jgi:hypothetical protein
VFAEITPATEGPDTLFAAFAEVTLTLFVLFRKSWFLAIPLLTPTAAIVLVPDPDGRTHAAIVIGSPEAGAELVDKYRLFAAENAYAITPRS